MVIEAGEVFVFCNFCSILIVYCCGCRGKIRPLACALPNSLFVSWNRNSFDSYRRGDNEIILPNSLWATLFIKSPNNS